MCKKIQQLWTYCLYTWKYNNFQALYISPWEDILRIFCSRRFKSNTYTYIIHKEFSVWLKFWTVRTMANKWEAKHDHMYAIKRALKGAAGKRITYVFVLCSFDKFSWRMLKIMTCLFPNSLNPLTGSPPTTPVLSSKWSQKARRWPFTSSGPFTKPLHHSWHYLSICCIPKYMQVNTSLLIFT